MADNAPVDEPAATTRDAFFGGRLVLKQPRRGHRSGTDAVLLAAAVSRDFAGLAYDVGAGVGAAGLGVAVAAPDARVILIERDPATAGLAQENITAGRFDDRVEVALCDALSPESRRALSQAADVVLTNPPFYDATRARSSPVEGRRSAHVLDEGITLAAWLAACLDLLRPRGELVVIHAAEAVPAILTALARRAGGCRLKPIHPQFDKDAHRVLVRAKKGSRAPFSIAPPLVLHGSDGAFTSEAERLHRGEAALSW